MKTRSPAFAAEAATHVRYLVLAMLFIVSTVNYADRAALSIAGPAAAKQLGLGALAIGWVLSAFGWAYVLGQLPGGWLLDRFGSVRVYLISIVSWSVITFLQGFVGVFHAGMAVAALFVLVFLMGLAESPAFPGNARIVAAWFPAKERGTAVAVFNSARSFATVVFALSGWITQAFGWQYVFATLGSLGLLLAFVWLRTVRAPADHPLANNSRTPSTSSRAAASSAWTSRRARARPGATPRGPRSASCSPRARSWASTSGSTASPRSPTSS